MAGTALHLHLHGYRYVHAFGSTARRLEGARYPPSPTIVLYTDLIKISKITSGGTVGDFSEAPLVTNPLIFGLTKN
jgi:hypothetical protein